jgi:hypothetical protein
MSEERFRFRRDAVHEHDEPPRHNVAREEPAAEEGAGPTVRSRIEEYTVAGDKLVSKVVQILREGNAMSVTVKDQSGTVLFEVPMSVGLIGTLLFPSVTALVFIGAAFANLKIVVERRV